MLSQKTRRNVPTVNVNDTNPMIVLAADIGASVAVLEIAKPMSLF